jgi:hypothetical protein
MQKTPGTLALEIKAGSGALYFVKAEMSSLIYVNLI